MNLIYINFHLLCLTGKPNTLDIIVFVLLVVFVALAIIAVAISCTIVYLNKRRKARRGTIATEVGNSVDEGIVDV